MRRALLIAALLAITASAFAAGGAAAVGPHPRVGKLPGFPQARGVIPVLDSPAAGVAHEQLVKGAFAAARANHHAIEATEGQACPVAFAFTQDVCYLGGPVLRDPTVHLIFWLGPNNKGVPTTAEVRPFPPLYQSTIERYFTDVAHDHGLGSDVFAVDPQYGESEEPGVLPGVNGISFSPADVVLDSDKFPKRSEAECPPTEFSEGPCVLDGDIQTEVESVAGTSEAGLGNVYLVFTPPGVGSCASFGCAYTEYCAYHGDFGGGGVFPPGNQTIYANIPFPGTHDEGCDTSGIHPSETEDGGTDAAIDNMSHELNEAITDPIGSQCKEVGKCEPASWIDAIGQEIGDKCLPPESTIAGAYGEPLGKTEFDFYNQLIDGDSYWTQREWSNAAGVGEGGCVQRMVETAFALPSGAQATVPVTFDGSLSGSPADPIAYWVWSFGDRIQAGSPQVTISHTYAKAGQYTVTLTAFDVYGNANTATHTVTIGPAPPPAEAEPIRTIVLKASTPAPGTPPLEHLTLAQLAARLGLPAAGSRLLGAGSIALGHAECPPACDVQLHLYTNVRTGKRRHRTVRQQPIGALYLTIATKGTGALALTLTPAGRALLHRAHTLKVTLKLAVEDQQGGVWQLTRHLTLLARTAV